MGMNKDELIRKHKPLTPDEVKRQMQAQEDAKKQYSQNTDELEAEIDSFNKVIDPLINPTTGKAMCWVRRPTQAEWEKLVPKELSIYSTDPDSIPPDIADKYNDMTFELMAKIIAKPEHDAKWWKEHANLVFIQLFQLHLTGIFKELGLLTTNF